VQRREARAHGSGAVSNPYVDLIRDASESAAVIEVRTGDRAGLLYALGRSLSEIRLSIRSAHISTLAGQAIDTFYITEADGSAPSAARAQEAVETLTVAAGIPAVPTATT
jgi:[protein-PII] uridylyltransferase